MADQRHQHDRPAGGAFRHHGSVLALAGTLAAKEPVHASAGTFRTDSPMFTGLLTGVVLIVGALTFLPAVSFRPIVGQFSHERFSDVSS